MRRAGKIDGTHKEIRDALRAAGIRVLGLGAYGNGVPDFVCSYRGFTAMVEAKSRAGEITERQRKMMDSWEGTVIVARSGPEATAKFFEEFSAYLLNKFGRRPEP